MVRFHNFKHKITAGLKKLFQRSPAASHVGRRPKNIRLIETDEIFQIVPHVRRTRVRDHTKFVQIKRAQWVDFSRSANKEYRK